MSMTPMQIIRNAYEYIQDINNWTQGYYNKYRNGENAPWREGECFCAAGALAYPRRHMTNEELDEPFQRGVLVGGVPHDYNAGYIAHCTLMRMSFRVHGRRIVEVNDDESIPREQAHKNVLKVYEGVLTMFKDAEPQPEFWMDYPADAIHAQKHGYSNA